MSKSVTILGSTGSVGKGTIDVVKANPDLFSVHALTAQTNVELLAEQAKATNAKLAVIGDESLHGALKESLAGTKIKTAASEQAILDAASEKVDCTMAAIVGMAGLKPLLAAIRNGQHVAIANKEPLIAAGPIVIGAANKSGATILPVDSEHNAIFQVFETENKGAIRRIILTASGGPFRTSTIEQMQAATPAQALAHPNWTMGRKISIDSATMFNKALEVIEAHYLFDMAPSQIDVLVHPQSVIHSMVEYEDGSVLAQMGASDMRVPITYALGWPNRISGPAQHIDFTKISNLTFEPVDDRRFPAIKLAYDCLQEGLASCIAFNAANEIAVEEFLGERIGFIDIFDIVQRTVAECGTASIDGLESIVAFDSEMRKIARAYILNKTTTNRKVS